MNMRILAMAILMNVVFSFNPYRWGRNNVGGSIIQQRLQAKHNEGGANRIWQHTDVKMRNMQRIQLQAHFLNSTVVIDHKSENRTLEIFFQVSSPDSSQVRKVEAKSLEVNEDYAVAIREEIRRFTEHRGYSYRSNHENLVQGLLNIVLEFEDAPYLCQNKTVIVFENRMQEAQAAVGRIVEEYNDLYDMNLKIFESLARGGQFSMNKNTLFRSVPRSESPINLNALDVPKMNIGLNIEQANTFDDPVEMQTRQDQLCDDELKKPYLQEKCQNAMRNHGRVNCYLRCSFEVVPNTQQLTLTSARFSFKPAN